MRLKHVAALACAGLIAAGAPARSQDKEAAPAPLSAVLGELQRGGLVIFFRHAETDPASAKDEAADLTRCETQRNLSAAGRRQAQEIGRAFRALRVPVGSVKSSPFCRCKDTAQLAFGKFTVDPDLFFSLRKGPEEAARLAGALRRMLSTPPATGTNTVIVSHTANLKESAGIWPKPEGVAYVFRPLPGGRFEAVARVEAEDWVRAAPGR